MDPHHHTKITQDDEADMSRSRRPLGRSMPNTNSALQFSLEEGVRRSLSPTPSDTSSSEVAHRIRRLWGQPPRVNSSSSSIALSTNTTNTNGSLTSRAAFLTAVINQALSICNDDDDDDVIDDSYAIFANIIDYDDQVDSDSASDE